jgi:hypothetical protein
MLGKHEEGHHRCSISVCRSRKILYAVSEALYDGETLLGNPLSLQSGHFRLGFCGFDTKN